jgi:glycosyltransferase involved in cell wall biosynthesis
MKIYTVQPHEDWCVDRLVNEWNEHNSDIAVGHYDHCDTIWLCADWCIDHVPYTVLKSKKVITTVHHITSPLLINTTQQINTDKKVSEKFFNNISEVNKFIIRHEITSLYHTPCKHTKWQLETIFDKLRLTPKPIIDIPFWINDSLWKKAANIQSLRRKYGLPQDKFLVGSFQRDSEGESSAPKLEKGPDILVDVTKSIKKDVHVVLTPWRRRFVVEQLKKHNISHSHFNTNLRLSFEAVNELYSCLDLYLVTSRVEGGPLAIPECAATRTPILSHYVGLAQDGLLHDKCILRTDVDYNESLSMIDESVINANYENVSSLLISNGGFNRFRRELFGIGV